MYDGEYCVVSGSIDEQRIDTRSEIVVCVNDVMYRAYHTGENDFSLYLKKSAFVNNSADIQVYVINGDDSVRVLSEIIDLQ